MATEITNMQLVLLFQFFQNNVYPLNGIDRAFLTYQDWGIDSYRLDVSVTIPYMLLQL